MPRYVSNLIHNAHSFKNLKCLFIDFCKTKELVNLPNNLEALFIRELSCCASYDYKGTDTDDEDGTDASHRINFKYHMNRGIWTGRDGVWVNNLPPSLKYIFIASSNISKECIRLPYGCKIEMCEGVCGEIPGEHIKSDREGLSYAKYERYKIKCEKWRQWLKMPKKLGFRNDEVLSIINCRQALKDKLNEMRNNYIDSFVEDAGRERYENMDERMKYNALYDSLPTDLQNDYDELSEEMNEEERMEYLYKWANESFLIDNLGRDVWNNLTVDQQEEELGIYFENFIEDNVHFIKLNKSKIINSSAQVDGEDGYYYFKWDKHKRVPKNMLKPRGYEIKNLYC